MLAQVNVLLTRLVGHVEKKRARVLESAQLELFRARRELDTRRLELVESVRRQRSAPTYDPNPVLPGAFLPASQLSVRGGNAVDGLLGESVIDVITGDTVNEVARTNGLEREPHVDIILCVHNALEDVKRCLESIVRHTDPRHNIIFVDDGSDAECAAYLQQFAQVRGGVTVLRNEVRTGYTKAANRGLQQATAEIMVLLNSDTIVSTHWLDRLVECAESSPKIGIVGPLSNAASYQSVPERFDPGGDWALNPLSPGWDIDHIAAALAKISRHAFPRVPSSTASVSSSRAPLSSR